MKKIYLIFTLFVLMFVFFGCFGCNKDSSKQNDDSKNNSEPSLKFTIMSNGEYEVTGIGTIKDSDVIIPETYKGKKVSRIGHNAFKNCTSITSISIPNSVNNLGWSVFEGSSIVKIEIPSTINFFPSYSFNMCYNLNEVYYNGTIEEWCNIEFEEGFSSPMIYATKFYLKNEANSWEEVKEIVVPSTISKIGYGQFRGFKNVTKVTLPDSVEIIGSGAFFECVNLQSIRLSSNLNKIEDTAFYSCVKLTEITIPNTVTYIGSHAFYSCIGLKDVVVPLSVEEIGKGAFGSCTNLESIIIPFVGNGSTMNHFGYIFGSDLLYMDGYYDNHAYVPHSLKKVIITGGTKISQYAFANCEYIETIEMSDTVKSIEKGAFSCCSALENIKLSNTLEVIKTKAFNYCQNLKTIFIPKSVSSIEYLTFSVCFDLTVLCEHTSIPTTWDEYWNGVDFMINNKIPTCKYSLGCTQK